MRLLPAAEPQRPQTSAPPQLLPKPRPLNDTDESTFQAPAPKGRTKYPAFARTPTPDT